MRSKYFYTFDERLCSAEYLHLNLWKRGEESLVGRREVARKHTSKQEGPFWNRRDVVVHEPLVDFFERAHLIGENACLAVEKRGLERENVKYRMRLHNQFHDTEVEDGRVHLPLREAS